MLEAVRIGDSSAVESDLTCFRSAVDSPAATGTETAVACFAANLASHSAEAPLLQKVSKKSRYQVTKKRMVWGISALKKVISNKGRPSTGPKLWPKLIRNPHFVAVPAWRYRASWKACTTYPWQHGVRFANMSEVRSKNAYRRTGFLEIWPRNKPRKAYVPTRIWTILLRDPLRGRCHHCIIADVRVGSTTPKSSTGVRNPRLCHRRWIQPVHRLFPKH
ncbi:hypothetical protein B0H11DRAFT_1309375 [Mycena galericulata]|nr:hypothetical protein B0H11DRAFT_1309375 [Mycena galericulata]